MSVLKTLRTIFTAETDEFKKNVDAAEKKVKDFKDASKEASTEGGGFGGTIKKIGEIAGGFLTADLLQQGANKILQFGKDSITAASDVAEMQSKFDVVFKNTAGTVEEQLGAMAASMNRSRYDMMGFAASFQDTFVPLGFARDQAAAMSVQLVQLAEDLSSFNNINVADVARDLQSAMVGNTETVRKYGVVANEAAINAEALKLGLWDGKGAMDAQAKAASILQIILDGTSDAQGDAARTADSFANSNRGLTDAVHDLQVEVGKGLIPTLQASIPHMTDNVRALTAATEANNKMTEAINLGAASQDDFNEMAKKLPPTANLQAEIIQYATDKINKYNYFLDAAQGELKDFRERQQGTIKPTQDAAAALDTETESAGLLASALPGVIGQVDSLKDSQDLLKQGISAVSDGLAEQERIKTIIAITTGELTGKEEIEARLNAIDQLQAIQNVNQAYEDHNITKLQWIQITSDGIVTQQELNDALGVTDDDINNIRSSVKNVDGIHATATIDIKVNGEVPNITLNKGQAPIPKQHGGQEYAGQPYLVGERGPEIFIPGQNGYMVPNNRLGGVTQNFYIYDQAAMALALASAEQAKNDRLNSSMGR
jgi:hypothetical protein